MPRNGSGDFNAVTNGWNPAVNGTPATPADWMAILNDISQALTQSVSRDGQTPILQNMPMGNNKFTGLAAGTSAGDSARFEQLFSLGQPIDLASAATTDIGAQLTTIINITGTETITSFGDKYNGPRFLKFAGVVTIESSAALLLPGGEDITTKAGDCMIVCPNGVPASGWKMYAFTQEVNDSVRKTSNTGAALLPEGNDAQRPATGDIPAGALLVRGNTQDPADYKPEFWNRVAAAWQAFASRPWVTAITDALGIRVTALEAVKNTANGGAPYYGCRAWVRFNGSGGATILASGNVLGVTYQSTGVYVVNLQSVMPHANYAVVATGSNASAFTSAVIPTILRGSPGNAGSVNIISKLGGVAGTADDPLICIAIFC